MFLTTSKTGEPDPEMAEKRGLGNSQTTAKMMLQS